MICPFRNGQIGLNSLCYIYFYNKTSLSIQNVNRSKTTPNKARPKNLPLRVPSTKINHVKDITISPPSKHAELHIFLYGDFCILSCSCALQ